MKLLKPPVIAPILGFIISCSTVEPKLSIEHQVTGAIETNCYLIYDSKSLEAALIDVGDEIDTLLQFIDVNGLNVKYILCTHGHMDHLYNVPAMLELFPEAKTVIHRLDYEDLWTRGEWIQENVDPETLEWLMSDPEIKKFFEFDPATFGQPDFYIEDGQELALGKFTIRAIHSPGHSPGSVCYLVDGNLFSGDCLFYRTVGRTDVQNSSREDQIRSVQRLYKILPDLTPVYPGHMQFTDILSEKTLNSRIKADTVTW